MAIERRTDCEYFEPKRWPYDCGDCQTDGHYLCAGCKHIAPFEEMELADTRIGYYPKQEKEAIAKEAAEELEKQKEAKGIPKTKAMNKTGKRIPILDAKHIGIRFGYSQVIITALDRGQVQPLVGVVLF